MHLLSNRSQMTAKCGKNKKETHKAIAKCFTIYSYHILMSYVICYWTNTWQHGIYLFYMRKRQIMQNSVSFNQKWVGQIIFLFWETHENSHLTQYILYTKYGANSLVALWINAFWLAQRKHEAVKLESSAVIIYASAL